jgi:nitroimidazol reductase NimA-like FMN-containing flavoprotein (pyridoxamine 5'-phosphate oxidase superfamily)
VPSRRDQIKLTPEEVAAFLARTRVMDVASNGRDGWPHVTALWFVMRGTEPWAWTYRKSQKVKNLERDNRATTLVESGTEYAELKGVMLRTRAHIEYDTERILDFAEELFAKYQGTTPGAEGMREALGAQAAKRVAIRFEVVETVTWDHSKLGGVY